MKACLKTSVSLSVMMIASPVWAQASQDAKTPASTVVDSTQPQETTVAGLQDIIVTAQRRSENLQNAAIAVTAVSSDQLIRSGVTDATKLTAVAPSLQVGTVTGAYNSFYLRGVGNFATTALNDAAIAFSVDGVFIARPSSSTGVFYDLERIEVLKGPQGTLYGRNATGGAINIITAKPKLGEFGGYLIGEYGNYDRRQLQAAINVPVGNDGAVRVAGQVTRRDGFYSDGTGDERSEAGRMQIALRSSQSLRLRVSFDYSHQGGLGPGGTYPDLINKDRQIGFLDPRAGAIAASTFIGFAGNFLKPLTTRPYFNNRYYGASVQADLDTSIGTLTFLPAYRRSELDLLSIASGLVNTQQEKDDQVSGELRLASPDRGLIRYLVGIYGIHEDIRSKYLFNEQYFGANGTNNANTDSIAAFGRLTFALTDRFRINAGARYTVDRKSVMTDSYQANVLCFSPNHLCIGGPSLPEDYGAFEQFASARPAFPTPFGTTGNFVSITHPIVNAERTFKKLTWRGGVEFDAGQRSLIYATVETGFKAGGFFSSIDDPTYQPETITAYTVGSKNRFLDNRLQLNLEAFYWDYRNQQVSTFRTNSIGGTEFVTQNVGKARFYGLEADANILATPTTLLTVNAQYLNARNTSFVYTSANQSPPGSPPSPPATGCPATLSTDVRTYTVNCSGFTPAQAPKWLITLGAQQTVELGSAGKLVFNAQARHQSRTFTGSELLNSEIQRAYWIGDGEISYHPVGDRFTIAAYVNNVTNKQIVAQSIPFPIYFPLVAQTLRPPRTYGVRAQVKF
ncbi:TonB-dependent receptor (plasmid) [Rhizorhabdus wittichii RW1]|uniref:TonB-dependent receptor n=2 Tax=Sphingomonadaceae TaxID=41297 RepID=A0A9J9HH96_RHIWR|nr:TonB-dependent receptor [Rhizorhabdus wittichii RW1]